ncbi:hypothetical protein ES706_06746 [subsurface metagenome]
MPKSLLFHIQNRNFNLAAHRIVYGLVKAKIDGQNKKKARRSQGQSERS